MADVVPVLWAERFWAIRVARIEADKKGRPVGGNSGGTPGGGSGNVRRTKLV